MPISFNTGTNEDFFDPDAFGVENVESGDEEEGIVFEAADEADEDVEDEEAGDEEAVEDGEEEGSVASVSEYQGDAGLDELPDRTFFEGDTCRAIFSFRSDQGRFTRVCGCKATICSREGHASMRNSEEGRASIGTYEPVRARKFTDGKLNTFMSKKEYLEQTEALKGARRAEMYSAAASRSIREEDQKPAEKSGILKTSKDTKLPPTEGGTLRTPRPSQARPPPPTQSVPFDKRGGEKVTSSFPRARPPPPTQGAPFVNREGEMFHPQVRPPPSSPAPPPLDVAGLMKVMTSTLMTHIDEKLAHNKGLPKEAPPVQDTPRPRGDHEKLKKKKFYAVINGRNGTNKVFTEWIGGAQDYVTGVPGAAVFKYEERSEAWAQVERHLATQEEFALENETLQGDRTMGGLFETNKPKPLAYPPLQLLGTDPSAKKDDEIFGIDIGSELHLREKLSPPGLTGEQAKSMADGAVDVIALPGGFVNDEKDNGGDLAMMSTAIEELCRQKRTETESSTKSDLHWKSNSRTALQSVKSLPELMKRCKVLASARDRVIKNSIRHSQNVLQRAGYTDPRLIEAWATNGFYGRITRDSMNSWIALHQHLLVLTLTDNMPWHYVQVEIDHHVEELQIIRNTHDSRLQALCGIYAYLRDGHAGNWHSTSLQYKRNTQLFSHAGREDASISDVSNDQGNFDGCSHCSTRLHAGDKLSCPWKGISRNLARKKGLAALKTLAEATPATTT